MAAIISCLMSFRLSDDRAYITENICCPDYLIERGASFFQITALVFWWRLVGPYRCTWGWYPLRVWSRRSSDIRWNRDVRWWWNHDWQIWRSFVLATSSVNQLPFVKTGWALVMQRIGTGSPSIQTSPLALWRRRSTTSQTLFLQDTLWLNCFLLLNLQICWPF